MDFGWPNVKIGQKMANGQPLFLALFVLLKSYITQMLEYKGRFKVKI